jgi:hypothetical protein
MLLLSVVAISPIGDARVTPEVAIDGKTATLTLEGGRNCDDD